MVRERRQKTKLEGTGRCPATAGEEGRSAKSASFALLSSYLYMSLSLPPSFVDNDLIYRDREERSEHRKVELSKLDDTHSRGF